MPRGGKREGAGRPAGALTTRTQEVAAKAIAEGKTPLEYMLAVMRNPAAPEARRDEMAKSAAPYVHPKLAAIEVGGDPDNPINHIHRIERILVRPKN